MDGAQIDGWMDGWMDRWIDRWIDTPQLVMGVVQNSNIDTQQCIDNLLE